MYSSSSSISIASPIHVIAQPAPSRERAGRFGQALRADRSPLHERALFLAFFVGFSIMALSFLGSIL